MHASLSTYKPVEMIIWTRTLTRDLPHNSVARSCAKIRENRTMESSGLWMRVTVCAVLLCLVTSAGANDPDPNVEAEMDTRAIRDFYPKDPNLTSEKQLLGALQEVLEKLQTKRIPPWEKKFGQVPMCDLGEQCAIRKGSRIGKMCDCPRGAFCNFFLLKCL